MQRELEAPLIALRREASDYEGSALDRALHRDVDGEVRLDRGTRALYATDSSNYRQVPIGVVVPRDADAVVAAVSICREHGVPIVLRGGGTSLAGQTCNHAVVIDVSRHLTRVEIDGEAGIARVEPGLVLDSLKRAALAQGWDFGPDPATHDRCTLGGMLGNNSCGVHSVFSEFYGPGPRTSDHVEELDVITYDGCRVRARATDARELARVRDLGGRIGDIYNRLLALRERYGLLVRARFPDMPRRVSGYNLGELLPERGMHVGRALVGSEATCVTVLGATLRLVRARPARAVALLGFPDIYRAAAAVPGVRALMPVGCEAIDHVLAERVRNLQKPAQRALELLPDGDAWLIVEFGAQTRNEARALAERARKLDAQACHVFDHDQVEDQLWRLRESALAVTAFAPGKPDTYEGWEDSAVPIDRLAAYLRDLHALYDQYGYHGALYGHFGQGCVHTRIDFDLRSPAGVDRYRRFTEDAARLVVSHGGSMSGEHGDGQARADLLTIMFGPELVQAFGEFKSIWDPDHQMNPGKLAYPNPRTSHLRLAGYDPHPGSIALVHGDDGKDFGHVGVRCVGAGKCRKLDGGTMCPSYMVTLDERHSTRGRAHLLYEMLLGDAIDGGWRSHEVREALDLCLACKACKHECPVGVDMASYKAEFLTHHYAHRLRPRAHYTFGWVHRWLLVGRPLAPLANLLSRTRALKWLAGIAPEREVPRIAHKSFRRTWQRPSAPRHAQRVLLWTDTFNDAFHPEVLHAASRVLAAAGYAVEVPRVRLCCGRPLFELGWIEPARRLWQQTFRELRTAIERGWPIVGIEPSCLAMFRDELHALFPDDSRAAALSANAKTLGELLGEWQPPRLPPHRVLYHRHCHQAAVLAPERDIGLLERAGLDVRVLDSGCCGMAGAFGFERDKYELSVALAERVLLPAIRDEPDAIVVADGFSCREQVRQLLGIRPRHVAEVIAEVPVLT
jgi:FAD/FMN-containing dehydrogenase/Fe-S oxidoreductase